VSPLTALMILPISASIAYAVELGGWNYMQRSMQNAADTAALAAASVNDSAGLTGTTTSQNEARAAAKKFGFVNGVNNTTVAAAVVTCPAGVLAGSVCYKADVSSVFPVLFSGVFGFGGNETISGRNVQRLYASAVATASGGGGPQQVCIGTLGTGESFRSNGGPLPNMAGCTIGSWGSMTCTGHDLGATYGVAVGTNSGCGVNEVSNGGAFTNPYTSLQSNISPTALGTCGSSFPQLVKNKGSWEVPATAQATNSLSGTPAWQGTTHVLCGDVQLAGDVTLTSGETVLYIENGRLDLNGHTLKTDTGAAATIIYSGNNTSGYYHYPSSLNGGGIIDIKAPDATSTSPWKGVAMYQDSTLTNGVSFTYSGNDPAWKITGLVYLPKADLTFSGIVNKASDGASCFILISYSVLVNGTAAMFANNTGCTAAGLTVPTVNVGTTREKLVL